MKFTKEEVLRIVDACFHAFASNYRNDAEKEAKIIMGRYETDQKVREHIDSVLPDECNHTYKESNGMIYTFRNICELCGKDMTKEK